MLPDRECRLFLNMLSCYSISVSYFGLWELTWLSQRLMERHLAMEAIGSSLLPGADRVLNEAK